MKKGLFDFLSSFSFEYVRTNLNLNLIILLFFILDLTPVLSFSPPLLVAAASANMRPSIMDGNLRVDLVTAGLNSPTAMSFLNNDDILILEKNSGMVRLVSHKILQDKPVLTVYAYNNTKLCCVGLLGMTVLNIGSSNNSNNPHVMNIRNLSSGGTTSSNHQIKTSVFLYYTESTNGVVQNTTVRNKVYRYDWNGSMLVNPKLILDLPAGDLHHVGGKLLIGKDLNSLYTTIGDLSREGQLQNVRDGPKPDGSSVILRVNPNNGSPIKDNPFMNINNINDNDSPSIHSYYAYGLRNSFGLAIDPITSKLWATDNGDVEYDEIDLVKPGFNGGWKKLTGPISRSQGITEDQLVNFPGSRYSDPVFSWKTSIGITAIEFLNSSKLGEKYKNNIFAGDINNGNLYYFKVNENRTGLTFGDNTNGTNMQHEQHFGLLDLVADDNKELSQITFGKGFGGITDIKTGPDGLLYILTFDREARREGSGAGSLYTISPISSAVTDRPHQNR